jgi:hypothetical protein
MRLLTDTLQELLRVSFLVPSTREASAPVGNDGQP